MTTRALRKPAWRPAVCILALGLGLPLLSRAQDRARDDQPAQDPEARLRQRLDAHRDRARKLAEELLPMLDEADRLRDELLDQEIAVKRAESDYENAKKTREIAEIAVREYLEGTYRQEAKALEGELTLTRAEKELASERLERAKKMEEKGTISKEQRQAAEQDLLKARISVDQAQEKARVLKDYTRPKTETALKAEAEKAKSDELAKLAALNLEQRKAHQLRQRLDKSPIDAAVLRVLTRLNEADTLEDQAIAALGDGKIDEGNRLADQAAAKLDEAARLWREEWARRQAMKDADVKRRIREAVKAAQPTK